MMTEYRPRTGHFERQLNNVPHNYANALVADLNHAEACLRERDAEIERLRSLIASLLKAGDAAIKGDYSEWDSLKPQEAADAD